MNKKKNWYLFSLQMTQSRNNVENTSILKLVVTLGIRLDYFHQYICRTVTLKKVGEKLKISRWLGCWGKLLKLGAFVLISTHYIRADMIWMFVKGFTSVLLEMYENSTMIHGHFPNINMFFYGGFRCWFHSCLQLTLFHSSRWRRN